jgi:hypothetical protein
MKLFNSNLVRTVKRNIRRKNLNPLNLKFEYQGEDYESYISSKPTIESRRESKARKREGKSD